MMTYDFASELALISDETLRGMVRDYMNESVPTYFWHIGASSSGKHHPCFSQGEGGLVRHTRAVVMFLNELMQLYPYDSMKQEYRDYAFAAAIIHDTCKYGVDAEMDTSAFKVHDKNAASAFETFCMERGYRVNWFLLHAVRAHMGQWADDPADRPVTAIDRVVHIADYMASRSFIDIPLLHKIEE